jgi:hypothetical protein
LPRSRKDGFDSRRDRQLFQALVPLIRDFRDRLHAGQPDDARMIQISVDIVVRPFLAALPADARLLSDEQQT